MRLPILFSAAILAAAADTPPADPAFDVRPARISISRQRYWQPDGKRSNDSQDFSVTLRFQAPADQILLGWRDLVITEAVSDVGEQLELNRNSSQAEGRVDADRMRMMERDTPSFDINLSFAWPQRPCNGLTSVKGTVNVLVAKGVPKRAVLKPLKDVLGKVMEVEGLAGGELVLERGSDGGGDGLTLRYPTKVQDRILGITFQDAAGRELRSRGWGGSSNGGEVERTYHVKVPDDGAVVVSLAPDSRAVSVPFTVTGLTLDAPAKAGRERVKVQATDEPAPKPEAGDVPVKAAEPGGKF